jgi:hypothetical protein
MDFGSSTPQVLCTGWLFKQGHMMPTWKERYFVLEANGEGLQKRAALRYQKAAWKAGDWPGEQLGSVPLHGASFLYLTPMRGSVDPAKWYCFEIITGAGQRYPLRCHSSRDRDLWAAQILAAINRDDVSPVIFASLRQ